MSPIDKLAQYFSKFPGIGPRAAKRFVYFLLSENANFSMELADAIRNLKAGVLQCSLCYRFFENNSAHEALCALCSDDSRDTSTLLVLEKDADLENVRKGGSYLGMYFVLGGSLPILEKEPTKKVRARELFDRVQAFAKKGEIKEVILAMSTTAEGENTTLYISKILDPLRVKYGFTITILGRGLSTGAELEYSDAETFKQAFENRK